MENRLFTFVLNFEKGIKVSWLAFARFLKNNDFNWIRNLSHVYNKIMFNTENNFYPKRTYYKKYNYCGNEWIAYNNRIANEV